MVSKSNRKQKISNKPSTANRKSSNSKRRAEGLQIVQEKRQKKLIEVEIPKYPGHSSSRFTYPHGQFSFSSFMKSFITTETTKIRKTYKNSSDLPNPSEGVSSDYPSVEVSSDKLGPRNATHRKRSGNSDSSPAPQRREVKVFKPSKEQIFKDFTPIRDYLVSVLNTLHLFELPTAKERFRVCEEEIEKVSQCAVDTDKAALEGQAEVLKKLTGVKGVFERELEAVEKEVLDFCSLQHSKVVEENAKFLEREEELTDEAVTKAMERLDEWLREVNRIIFDLRVAGDDLMQVRKGQIEEFSADYKNFLQADDTIFLESNKNV